MVKCPRCEYRGIKHEVYPDPTITTTLVCNNDFVDEKNNFHSHDRNKKTRRFTCSKGHVWEMSYYDKCWCGWISSTDQIVKFINSEE